MEEIQKNRGQLSKSLLKLFYLFFIFIGTLLIISNEYSLEPIYLAYIPFIAGIIGLISVKIDKYFLPISFAIGIFSISLFILNVILSYVSNPIYPIQEQTYFLIFGILVIGTTYGYKVQTR